MWESVCKCKECQLNRSLVWKGNRNLNATYVVVLPSFVSLQPVRLQGKNYSVNCFYLLRFSTYWNNSDEAIKLVQLVLLKKPPSKDVRVQFYWEAPFKVKSQSQWIYSSRIPRTKLYWSSGCVKITSFCCNKHLKFKSFARTVTRLCKAFHRREWLTSIKSK